jgi:RNA polymerase sigma-70 factor (ECF subfamily)
MTYVDGRASGPIPPLFCGNIARPAGTLLAVMTQPAPSVRPQRPTDPTKIDWQATLAEHDRWLRTVVYARLGEAQAVDEVMQEVALAAVRQRAPLADPGKAAPWLYRVAVRQTLLYRRRQGRRRKLTDGYARRNRPTERDTHEPDPLGWLLAEERRSLIRAALGRLPKRDAEVLLLKYTEGWSYRDLADHLGTSQGAVQSRLHRARARMRRELAALEVIESEA